MSMFVCALSLAVALLLDPTTAGPVTSARQLYQAAATAIEQRDLPRATELLEQLLQEHADWALAEVAAYHLAECLWLQQQPQAALDVLANWSSRIEQHARANSAQASLTADTASLLSRIVESLEETPDTLAMLAELLSTADATHSPLFTFAIANDLSRRYQISGDYQQSQDYLRQAVAAHHESIAKQVANRQATEGQATDPQKPDATADEPTGDNQPLPKLTDKLQTRLQFELPLSWAEHELSQGHAVSAVDILDRIDVAKLSTEQTLAVRFLLAEALFAAGRQTAAGEQFQWLTEQAAEISPKPTWLAAIVLRRGELLVRTRDISAAQQWLLQAKRDHADFARAYEFDYLLARCAVARIEFDEAQDWLQAVIDAPAAEATEAVPRAAWMLGEVHFLQRQFAQALDAYASVAHMNKFPEWQARALLQSAKCHELLGQTSQALAEYQQALQLTQQPEVQQSATERVAALQAFAGELR